MMNCAHAMRGRHHCLSLLCEFLGLHPLWKNFNLGTARELDQRNLRQRHPLCGEFCKENDIRRKQYSFPYLQLTGGLAELLVGATHEICHGLVVRCTA